MNRENSIVLELQRDAVDGATRVSDLLRKALVVARKLSIPEFEAWINQELSGYEQAQAPAYRLMEGCIVERRYNQCAVEEVVALLA